MLAAFACLGVIAGSASANTYSVYTCAGPSGESLPNKAWTQERSSQSILSFFTFDSSCPGLSVTAVSPILGFGDNAGFDFVAPAGTSIAGYLVNRTVTVSYLSVGSKPAISAGLRRTVGGAETYAGECEAVVVNCSIANTPAQASGLNASALQLGVECVQSGSCGSLGINSARALLVSARVDLKDDSPPKLAITGGNLPAATGTAGTRDLDVAITDAGGGIRNYLLAIDGVNGKVTESGGACTDAYTQTVPCPLSKNASFKVDLAAAGPGSHNAVVYATDAAGNVSKLAPVKFSSGPIFTSNGTPFVTVPVVSTKAKVIEGRGGKAVSIRGSLKTREGAPIAGAVIDVTATSVGGSASGVAPLGFTRTTSKGAFKFKVKPKGARNITFSFRPSSSSQSTSAASMLLRQRLSLSARRSKARLRRGQKLKISGRLSGAAASAVGAPVTIQVRNGSRWQTVATVSAGKGGKYVWIHRFTKVTRPTLFTFRAAVKASGTWPWKSKTSSSVKVLVLG